MPIAIVGPSRSRERAWSASAARGAISSSRAPRTSSERLTASQIEEAADPGEDAADVGPVLLGDVAVDAGVERDPRVLVAVADVAGHFGARQQAGGAAGGEEVAVDPAGDEDVAAEDDHVAVDFAGDRGVAAGDVDAVDGLAAGDGDVAGDDDDRALRPRPWVLAALATAGAASAITARSAAADERRRSTRAAYGTA